MKRLYWYVYGIRFVIKDKIKQSFLWYSKRKMLSHVSMNDYMYRKIKLGEPFFAGRLGLFELAAMRAYEFQNTTKYEIVMNQIYECAGFFPNDISLGNRFLEVMKVSMAEVDALGCSGLLCEDYFMDFYTKKETVGSVKFWLMEPWRYEKPWSAALKGKKVLVVTPFTDSVEEQHKKRELLFQGTDILPEFELITYRSLQTTGDLMDDRFETWFEALDFMYSEIKDIDFDIALLGCGAYGFPLAARIKKDGKQAIHMGGVLQILFGIMGKRWDGTGPNSEDHKMAAEIAPFYNEYWTYPKQEETPVSATRVEYGPYWR